MLTVLGLNGKPFKMDTNAASFPMRSEKACKSRLQYECGRLLNQKIVCEVHGKQHDEYTPFFHKTKANFKDHQDRDQRKKQWCEMNEFSFYEVRSIEDLKQILGITDEPTNS